MHNELPKININLFTGDYKDWTAFKNIFDSTIHIKQHLTAIQKLHYLTRKNPIFFVNFIGANF